MENLFGMDLWFGNAFGRIQFQVFGSCYCNFGSYYCYIVEIVVDIVVGVVLNLCQVVLYYCLDFLFGLVLWQDNQNFAVVVVVVVGDLLWVIVVVCLDSGLN